MSIDVIHGLIRFVIAICYIALVFILRRLLVTLYRAIDLLTDDIPEISENLKNDYGDKVDDKWLSEFTSNLQRLYSNVVTGVILIIDSILSIAAILLVQNLC